MITQEELKALLHYDQDTGFFTRISKPSHRLKIGQVAGCVNQKGYVVIHVNGELHYGHRLAILYMTGKFPEEEVDHANRIKSDNSWKNLRECTKIQNRANSPKPISNTSGYKNVKAQGNGTFYVKFRFKGKFNYLTGFDTAESAYAAYVDYAKKLHGEFFNYG